MKGVYPVLLSQETDHIIVSVPDFEAYTQGKDLSDAIEMARDLIGIMGIFMQDMNQELPIATPILSITKENDTDIVICINKCDIAEDTKKAKGRKAAENIAELKRIYEPMYPVVCIDSINGTGFDQLMELIKGKVTALAGPSGVGKSTILNRLIPEAFAETGSISEKSQRGKHTTRHSELFTIDENEGTMIFDTPGFTSFDILEADEDELHHLYPDIAKYIGNCRYNNCRHIAEPECEVIKAVEEGNIDRSRYESYKAMLEEIKKAKQY